MKVDIEENITIEPVYCKNCKYLKIESDLADIVCKKNNIKNWFGTVLYRRCININYKKDCKDYKRKWWKVWA